MCDTSREGMLYHLHEGSTPIFSVESKAKLGGQRESLVEETSFGHRYTTRHNTSPRVHPLTPVRITGTHSLMLSSRKSGSFGSLLTSRASVKLMLKYSLGLSLGGMNMRT